GLAERAQLIANTRPDTVPLSVGGTPSVVHASYVSANYFSVTGVHPASGRFFAPDEDRMGAGSPVAVISYALWRRQFGGDPGALGRTVEVGFQSYTIIGVAERGFAGTDLDAVEVWLPI